jgi:2-keto-3-deoxy-galactonokinase
LQHRCPLFSVFGLVVDRAHAALLMGKALFDPIRVVPGFVQQRARRAPQVMRAKLGEGLSLLLCQPVCEGQYLVK